MDSGANSHRAGSSDEDDDAARRGAAHAFGKPSAVRPLPRRLSPGKRQSLERTTEAKAASPRSNPPRAGLPGLRTQVQTPPPATREADSPVSPAGLVAARLRQLSPSPAQVAQSPKADAKSPSLIAAALAARRGLAPNTTTTTTTTTTTNTTAAATPSRLRGNPVEANVDSASIPPTGSLISMFEDAQPGSKETRKASVLSPQPRGKGPARKTVAKPRQGSSPSKPIPVDGRSRPLAIRPSPKVADSPSPGSSLQKAAASSLPPSIEVMSPRESPGAASSPSLANGRRQSVATNSPISHRFTTSGRGGADSATMSSDASATPSRGKATLAPSSINRELDSLTSAIMAGSLASARMTPHTSGASAASPPRLPQITKPALFRQTLRQPASFPDEDLDRYRRHQFPMLHSGKHAHHEGSRKRWREEMTARERKRYEAVWASNRGRLLGGGQDESPRQGEEVVEGEGEEKKTKGRARGADCVANVIVRELWRRSRLPEDDLAEVWDLVDRDKAGMLPRQEFVVGMWLIDQRLRGRKLPVRVSDSVWGSAIGVKVRKPKKNR